MNQPSMPQRRKLPHDVPSWVREDARHFISVNCRQRGTNVLCHDDIAETLFANARRYEAAGHWYLWLMLLMPDHLHIIATFNLQRGVKTTMAQWKRFQSAHYDIDWQPNFFEHRLRDEDEFVEKAEYVRLNPVRKKLVETPEEWLYVIDRKIGE